MLRLDMRDPEVRVRGGRPEVSVTTLTRVTTLEQRCARIEAAIAGLTTIASNIQAAIADLITAATDADSRLTAIEAVPAPAPVDLAAVVARLDALDAQLDPVTGSVLRDRGE